MSRRQFLAASITASLAAIALTKASRVVRADDSAMTFVRDLYTREIARHLQRAPVNGDTFTANFAAPLRRLMAAPREASANEPLGIVHAFFGPGVLPGTDIKLAGVASAGDAINVALVYRGEPRSVTVRPVREDGEWRIADVTYASGESLLTRYRRLTGL